MWNISGNYLMFSAGDGDNNVRIYSDLRVPITYDSNNTGYYVDPNGTSNLNRLVLQPRTDNYYVGSVSGTDPVSDWQSLTNTTGQFVVSQFNNIGLYTNSPAGVYGYGAVMSWRTANHSFQLYASHTGDLAYKTQWNNDNYSGWLTPVVYGRNGGTSSGKTIYGSIYYDTDNTAYFTDPASRSRQASIDFGSSGYYIHAGDWGMRNTTPYGWIQFGPANTSHAHIYTDRSNFYFNAQLIVNGGSNINTSDIRANLFYDNQNTAYYTDPASESVLNTVTFFGELNLSASGQTYIDHTGTIIFRRQDNYTSSASLSVGGDFITRGNITAYGSPSDINLKENIENIPNALEKVLTLNGVNFNYKKDGTRSTGVIAQEVEEVLPEVVYETTDIDGTGNFKAVRYGNMVGLLIEAIKEQQTVINNMQAEINSLKRG
jgi:hypothetical protein